MDASVPSPDELQRREGPVYNRTERIAHWHRHLPILFETSVRGRTISSGGGTVDLSRYLESDQQTEELRVINDLLSASGWRGVLTSKEVSCGKVGYGRGDMTETIWTLHVSPLRG